MDAALVDPPGARRRSSLRNPQKAVLATALIQNGESIRKVAKTSGLSTTTVIKLKRQGLVPQAHVEAVKKLLRDKAALVADSALNAISNKKLKESPARDLAYIAKQAIEMAGLQAPSIVEQFTYSIQKYETKPPEADK